MSGKQLLLGLTVALLIVAAGLWLTWYEGNHMDEAIAQQSLRLSREPDCRPNKRQESYQFWRNGELRCEIIEDRRD